MPAYVISIDSWHVRTAAKEYVYRWRYATRTSDGMINSTRYPVDGNTLPANAFISPKILGRSRGHCGRRRRPSTSRNLRRFPTCRT